MARAVRLRTWEADGLLVANVKHNSTVRFEAALSWNDPSERRVISRQVVLGEEGEPFGLLEFGPGFDSIHRAEGHRTSVPAPREWALYIPAGTQARVKVGDRALDLQALAQEPSGERRLALTKGLVAEVTLGPYTFQVSGKI